LEEELSAAELMEWQLFFAKAPWGPEVDFYRTGVVAATMLNIHRDPKRKPKPWHPGDFMPHAGKVEEKPAPLPGEMKAKFLTVFGGRIKHSGKDHLPPSGREGDGAAAARSRPKGRKQARRPRPSRRR
jgi:hypothetical protein